MPGQQEADQFLKVSELVSTGLGTISAEIAIDCYDAPDDVSLPSDDGHDDTTLFERGLRGSIENVVDVIKDLYRLSFRVRNSTTKATKAGRFREVDSSTGLEIFKDCYAKFDYDHVLELFRSVRHGSQEFTTADYTLIQRFAIAITARRRQIRYWQKHSQKLAVVESQPTIDLVTQAIDPPREPSLAEKRDAISTIHVLTASGRPTKTIHTSTEATFFDPKLDLTPLETQSVISIATTARDLEGRPANLPPPPGAAQCDRDFVCPYCYILCPSRHGQSRAWRSIIFLRPRSTSLTMTQSTHRPRSSTLRLHI